MEGAKKRGIVEDEGLLPAFRTNSGGGRILRFFVPRLVHSFLCNPRLSCESPLKPRSK